MASLKVLMPPELFGPEFRGRRFKDFEEMVDSTKIFLADRPTAPKAQASSVKDSDKMDIGELALGRLLVWKQGWL